MENLFYRNNDRSFVHRTYPRGSSPRMIVSRYTGILGLLGALLVSACKNPQTPANPSPSRKMLPSPLGIGYPGLSLKPGGTPEERSGSNNPIRGNVSQLTVVYSYSPANTGGLKAKPDWLLVDADGRVPDSNITELTPALTPAVEGDTPPSAVYTLDPVGKALLGAAKFVLNADNGKITKNIPPAPPAGGLSPTEPFIITVKGKSGTIYEGHEQKVYIYIRTDI